VCPHCSRAFVDQSNCDRHAKVCNLNLAPPPDDTVLCNHPGCPAPHVKIVAGNGAKISLARHMANEHNKGAFWPCPYEHCDFEPRFKKDNVIHHLRGFHGQTPEAAKELMAPVQPTVR
jgi:hypothetical protein